MGRLTPWPLDKSALEKMVCRDERARGLWANRERA